MGCHELRYWNIESIQSNAEVCCQKYWHCKNILQGWDRLVMATVVWHKQWNVRRGCLEKIVLGNSQESSGLREFPLSNFSDNLWGFSTIFQTFRLKSEDYEAQTYPRVHTEHIAVLLQWSLTVMNPDFTGVIRKSRLWLSLCRLCRPLQYSSTSLAFQALVARG